MSPFDHVTTLFSFVYALALTHLLSRVGSLVLARDRVKFSGLQTLATVNAGGQVFLSWLYLWSFRSITVTLDLGRIVGGFIYAIILYFVCAAAAPDVEGEAIDLGAFYGRNRRLFYGLYAACTLAAVVTELPLLSGPKGAFTQAVTATLPFFVPCLIAIAIPSRVAQWVAGVGLFVLTAVWLALFSAALV
jgi:hypothetical protein